MALEGKTLAVAVALLGVVGVGVGMAALFAGGPPPAPPRPQLPAAPTLTGSELKYSPAVYRGLVEQDAKTFGVPAPSPAEMAAVFPYFDESPGLPRPRVGTSFATRHLKVTLSLRREEGAIDGKHSFRADHLVLEIENRTAHHLAYRVSTKFATPARCEAKGVIAHNAVALRPHEKIIRTECLFQSAPRLDVVVAEVMEIPALSYYYLSRLEPGLILYDTRTAAGHTIPKGAPCPQTFSWRDVREGAARGEVEWRDIIDFYARHSCDEYAFFAGYRYRRQPGIALPVRPPEAP